MPESELILLPGLDGTGDLFAPLLHVIGEQWRSRVIAYPPDRAMSYDELLPIIQEQMPRDRPVVLVAESFSGPLALRYAAAHPASVRAVVLCASFISSPVPRWMKHLVLSALFRLPMPSLALRLVLVGWNAPHALVNSVRTAIHRVHPSVLAYRVRQVMELNCGPALVQCDAPMLYLRAMQDRLVGANSVRRILAKRNMRVRTVDGPHLLLQVEPQAAWTAIDEFLQATAEPEQAADQRG